MSHHGVEGVRNTSFRDGIIFESCTGVGGIATRRSDGARVATLWIDGVCTQVSPERYFEELERLGLGSVEECERIDE